MDGVIAIDQRALQSLVGALAPLAVESSSEPVSASNILTFVRQAWAEPEKGVTKDTIIFMVCISGVNDKMEI